MASADSPPANAATESASMEQVITDTSTPLIRLVDADADVNSDPPQVEEDNNADLYIVTPPAYTQSIAEGEQTVDAEEVQEEKPDGPSRSPDREAFALAFPRAVNEHPEPARPATPLHVLQERARGNAPLAPTGPDPVLSHYLTEPATIVSLIGIQACSLLPNRPAIWLMKRKKMALSPLAATVLVKEGLICAKDLELISQHPGARRDPTDPISGILLGVYDTVGEISLGLVAGPVELGRQATPVLRRYESSQRENPNGNTQPLTGRELLGAPQAAGKVALEAGKGLGRIVTASLKTPMVVLNGVTRGFHNLPKAYGEEVRVYENVTGVKSGMRVGAKSFAYGLGDGLLDLFMKPVQGAQRNGALGVVTGFAKGVGNLVCKPTAGAVGVLGYTSVGIYKEIRNIKFADDDETCPADLVRKLGEAEYAAATDSDKLYVVRVWCQTMMHVRLV
ncbi:hypothetical protein HBI56_162330 [Parastagonospora nodorum]|uniref:Vacuolar protein sorting-associated protein 13 DH-like domain-containing protein n=1 Tax=Phaeosphaeria nodorum (strain SN15 / ATCC MYA-4574 / FGSC 10173) TaxID=321614 RepID=A0A7U2I9X0_PHANO|nr:hypothetical protein HBH56_210310 [Parastagonospora nodorum]QRD05932.1 hypothetical protein JI435_201420 [Parastagonospora nodorum SN15]KAH3931297.1 hypothetical protein HBH54_098920 [Parastagonospora nodorum]KAH3944251.1 hypothetical protein HBH53_160380 [Parastagonospora nodorum]KAH3960666.1 hypothetical protein HBH51_188670 [Parastagonospora nodorum]